MAELELTFARPVTAFGAYFSSLESNYAETIVEFDEGSGLHGFSLPIHDYDASVLFYGLLFEQPVRLVAAEVDVGGRHAAGLLRRGDLVYAAVPVPEPGTLTLLGFGLVGASRSVRRRRRAGDVDRRNIDATRGPVYSE